MSTAFDTELAFTRTSDVSPDLERPGLLRARTLPPGQDHRPDSFAQTPTRVRDWSEDPEFQIDLVRNGFDCVDLSAVEGLLPVLERVRDAGHVSAEEAREIRHCLVGQWIRLSDGSRVRFQYIAAEGFIMRKGGPNGMAVTPPGSMTEMNDHDAAGAIHADQDILGTPLRQIMRGAAPWMFRHDAPDSRNGWSPLMLLNLWIPLQQITRPLVLMDKTSLDRPAHQLRYGLPTDAFLERDSEKRVNDIWTFLHDEGQRWYARAQMPLGSAYLFETLGTPHGSCKIPGEALAENRYRRLAEARDAIGAGDEAALAHAVEAGPLAAGWEGGVGTRPLREAIRAMDDLLAEAQRNGAALCRGEGAEEWAARSQRGLDAVVRKSIEMRVVAVRLPRLGARASR